MSAPALLDHARRVLDSPGMGGHSARLAAFLTRQALEEIVDRRCAVLEPTSLAATTRSKLLLLRCLDDQAVAERAALAWNRLSTACHVHAYELAPSIAEIAQLREQVAALERAIE